jgi:transcriptional regulator with XRE-family HTH domain
VPRPSRARDPQLAVAFGQRLRQLRVDGGLTQEQVAERADVHATFVSNVERGYSSPTLDTLVRLAAAVGVRPGQLVDGLVD